MTQTKNPHVLETESIGKLLIQYSIPAIIAMTVTSVYNIVDSIFIGHGVGPLAISGPRCSSYGQPAPSLPPMLR